MVGRDGLEPPPFRVSAEGSNQLSYLPMYGERGGNRTRHCHGFADRALVQYWELALWLRRKESNLFHWFQRPRHYRYATPHYEMV